MAAYAALVSAARTLDECCNDVHVLHHEKEEIESLLQSFISLQAFLEGFPQEAKHLEGRIRDAACHAEDLIEDYVLKRLDFNGEDRHMEDLINEEFQNVAQEIRSIEEEVIKIQNNRGVQDQTMINAYSLSEESTTSPSSYESPPPTAKDVMVGFDDQLMQIKSKLCGESSKRKVIPIFGMGGIGKTTLARNAFDDQLTKEYFHLRSWVTLSETYSLREIFLSLLVSFKVLDDVNTCNKSVEWLKERVYKSLKGWRYLIVLDDVWSTKAWDGVGRMFPDDNNGSRVLLTTRISEVANYTGDASNVHSMDFLDADQSWNLLREKVFSSHTHKGDDYVCHHPELVDIGKEIARKCAGLPLTIVVLAGILRNVNQTQAAWKEIARKVNAKAVGESGVANVLSLSYQHLPHHLRPCLLYMAAFPEDYKIRVSYLSKLWMAEGFLKPAGTNNRSKSLEKTAEEYLEDLVSRSLVLAGKRDICNGRITSCSVHDLLRDMCIRKAQEEKFLIRISKEFDISIYDHQNLRRLCAEDLEGLLEIMEQHPTLAASVRTFLCFGRSLNHCPLSKVASNARFLRIIHAPDAKFADIGPEIFRLLKLRYLNLCCPHTQISLSEDAYKLNKLQSLILGGICLGSPFKIQRMPQLRHFEANDVIVSPYSTESSTPVSIQALSTAASLHCCAEIFKLMANLKELRLFYNCSKRVDDFSCYQLENLVHFGKLERLKLHIGGHLYKWRISSKNFVPPKMLRKLVLRGCQIAWEEVGIITSSLPKLECLILEYNACRGQVWETKEGQFRRLKKLKLKRLYFLQQWIAESSHFPRLECLNIYDCYRFEIPNDTGEMPTLQLIKLKLCSETLLASAKRIKNEQEALGNDALRLQILR